MNKASKNSNQAQPADSSRKHYQLAVLLTVINAVSGLSAWGFGQYGGFDKVALLLWLVSYVAGGYFGTIEAFVSLKNKSLNIDFIMVIAALGAAFIGRPAEGAVLLFLFSLSNSLQKYALDKSRKSISSLIKLRPKFARIKREDQVTNVLVDEVQVGEICVVRPGETIPLDGQVISGESDVNQANLTGESVPVFCSIGSKVMAGTMNASGYLEIKVSNAIADTTLAKVIELVEQAQQNKAKSQRWLDRYEMTYAVIILAVSLVATLYPYLFLEQNFYTAFYKAINFLVVASPCALIISVPASIVSAIANGAKNGVLFKGGSALDAASDIKVLALDKTGTVTLGVPTVNRVYAHNRTEQEFLTAILPLEEKSEHLLAKAITNYAAKFVQNDAEVTNFQAIHGMGVQGVIGDHWYFIGNQQLFQKNNIPILADLQQKADEFLALAQTVIYACRRPINFSSNNTQVEHDFLGLVAISDPINPDASKMIADLRKQGLKKIVLLTGDNYKVAANVCQQLSIDEFYADLLPPDKTAKIVALQKQYGKIAMFGDGVNDAPSIITADFGIAMGDQGSDLAIEAADTVLMSNKLQKITHLFGLAKATKKIIIQNLFFSCGVIIYLVGYNYFIGLPLPYGVVAHEGSTILVVLNGLRLLFYR